MRVLFSGGEKVEDEVTAIMRRSLTAPCLATLLPRRHLIPTTTTAAALARSLSLVPQPPLGNSDRLAVWMPILRPEVHLPQPE